MKSRWNDARGREARGLDLSSTPRGSRCETSLVVWGGANTSIKTSSRSPGRQIPVSREGTAPISNPSSARTSPGADDDRACSERQDMGDQEMVGYLPRSSGSGRRRPSDRDAAARFVTAPPSSAHADAIVSLTKHDRPREVCPVYGDVIASTTRGFQDLARWRLIAEHPSARPRLRRHGTITGARVDAPRPIELMHARRGGDRERRRPPGLRVRAGADR